MQAAKEFITDFVAGCAGGTACVYCGQPLDTIKVKLQTFPNLYSGPLSCFKHTLKTEGFVGLYKGSVPALVCNVSENAVLFVALGAMKKLVASLTNSHPEKLSNLQNASAGSLASIFSALVVCPTEIIKCRMQALQELHSTGKISEMPSGPMSVLRGMLKNEGWLSPMQGLTSTWVREMPGYFVFFYGYEMTRGLFTPPGKTKDDIGVLPTIVAGGTAGLFLWVFVFPVDMVKSRIQVLSAAGKQQGFVKTFTSIARTEGLRAFYRGLLPMVIRTYPANGALFVAYEWTRKYFGAAMGLRD